MVLCGGNPHKPWFLAPTVGPDGLPPLRYAPCMANPCTRCDQNRAGFQFSWFGHGLAGLACHCQVVNLVRLGNVLPPQPFHQEALLLAFRKLFPRPWLESHRFPMLEDLVNQLPFACFLRWSAQSRYGGRCWTLSLEDGEAVRDHQFS